jgi:hypothetical protein
MRDRDRDQDLEIAREERTIVALGMVGLRAGIRAMRSKLPQARVRRCSSR